MCTMNKIYKVIWSKVKACYVVVSELAKRHSKCKSAKPAISLAALVTAFMLTAGHGVVYATDLAPTDNVGKIGAITIDSSKVDDSKFSRIVNIDGFIIDNSVQNYGTFSQYMQNIYGRYNQVGTNRSDTLLGLDGGNTALGCLTLAGIELERNEIKDADGNVINVTYATELAPTGGARFKKADGHKDYGYATALGFATAAAKTNAIATGHYTVADGLNAFSGGSASMATNDNAFAFGRGVLAAGANSFAFGEGWRRNPSEEPELIASGKNSVAMGDSTKAFGKNSVALGHSTKASGQDSVALNGWTEAKGDASLAAGNSSKALADNSTALSGGLVSADAKNAAAIGKDASAQLADSVALGSKSIADRAGFTRGYNPKSGAVYASDAEIATVLGKSSELETLNTTIDAQQATYNEKKAAYDTAKAAYYNNQDGTLSGQLYDAWSQAATELNEATRQLNASQEEKRTMLASWKSGVAAVSVGDASTGRTRQITGVAAGSEDTDAVNVAQLKALSGKVDEGAVHYYSVKSDQQGAGTNYANDGAKAADSMVIGISSSISEKAKNSTVLGNNNTLSNQPNARGVERDSENNSIVVGQNLTVEGARNAVFGTDYQNGTDKLLTHVAGERNTVIGVGNLVGYTAERVGTEWKYTKFKGHGDDENVVVGLTNTVNGGGVVVGTNTTVSAYGGVAFGHHNTVSGDEDKGVALGNDLNVSGYGALAVGTESTATGDYTIALGVESKAEAQLAASMGYQSQAKASGSVALGAWSSAEAKQALALGYDSQAMVAGGVALGAKSVANRGKDVLGYDPVTGAAFANDAAVAAALGKTAELTAAETNIANAQTAVTAAQQAYDADQSDANKQALRNAKNTLNTAKSKKNELLASYKSVFGAVSVGRNDGTRQITNLAAGTEDTDAVNVAQLKALSGKVDEGAVHYFSVAADDSAKPENTNWNNDGATGAKAIAIGRGAKADGKHSIALGSDGAEFSAPKTTGEAAIAIGSGAEAGVQDISIGLGAKATGGFGVAIGRQSEAKASTAVAMAYGAKAEGANSLAIGILSDAKTNDSAAYGREAKALGDVSLAVGAQSKAGAAHTAVFGAKATTDATAWNGTAIGRSAYIGKQAPDGTTPNIGVSNNYFTPVDDDTVVAPGKETMNSTAVGFGAKAFGYQDTALGAGAEAFDTNTVSIGVMSKAIGHYANALGKQARAEGKDSVAIGHWARSIGESSMALGDYAITSTLDGTTSVTKSAAIGSHARAASDNSVALGANSLANIADDVATKAYLSNEAFAKENGVVSVGNEEYKVGDTTVAKNYRRITNVAGGAADNDAVNVAQLKALSQKTDNQRTHYYHVNDGNSPVGNYNNDGAKGGMALAAGAGAVANGTASAATGAFNQIQGNGATGYTTGFQGATSSIYGSFNTIAGKDDVRFDGVANSIVGVANRTENANGALIFGAGNKVTNSYREVSAGTTPFDVNAASEALQKAIDNGDNTDMIDVLGGMVKESGGSVLAIGGANTADYALLSKVVGVGNKLTGTSNTPSEYNMLDGFANTAENVQHVSVIGSNNKLSNTKNAILLGDNRKLTGANGSIVLGAADTENGTELKAADAVLIGHNADVQKAGGVALGADSVANTEAGVSGYDPSTGKSSTEKKNPVWTSGKAAVSVGNADNTRQITNLAAGAKDTDAVNVAQLKALNKQVTEGAVHYFSVKADDSANPVGTNWNNDGAKSTGSIAVGQKARTLELEVEPWKTPEKISSDHAVALGSDASAAGNGSVAIGKNAVTGTRFATESLGGGASLTTAHNIAGDGAVAVGDSSQAGTEGSVAIGRKATAGYYGALLNHTTKEKKSYGIAIGDGAKAIGNYNRYSRNDNRDDAGLAVGRQAYAAGNGTIAMGYKAHAANTQNIIIGSNASTKALFKNDGEETVHPISSVGIGSDVVVKGRYSVALGPGASVGNGKLNLPESTSFMDFGGVALGHKSQVDRPGSVGLGSWTRPWRQVDPKHPIVDPEHPEQPIDEQTKYADGKKVVAPFSGQKLYFKDDIGGAQVYHAMGSNSVVNGVVSVGGVYEGLGGRKIPFLRQIINVADGTEDTDAVNLRQLKAVNADVTTDIKALQDGFTVSNAAGEKQNIALGGDTKQNIKFQGEAGKIDVDVAHASDGATVTVKANANLGKNIDLSSNTTVTNITNNLSRGFELRAGTESTGAKIALDGNETPAIRFDVAEADKGLTVKREGNTVKYGIDGSKIDLTGNTAITNITSNLSQASAWKLQVNGKNERVIGKDNVVNFVAGSYTEVTADGNDVKIGLNKAAKDKLDKVDTLEGQIKANKVQVTGDAVTGVKVADKKEADGSTTYTVSLDKKIQVGGVAVNGKDGKGEVTGLTNTSLNVAGFATSKRAATEEQLQLAMDQMSANAKITTVESGDENIVVNKTKGQNENKYTVALNKNLNVDSLNAGGTQVNKDGISVRGADGKPGVTITKNGIDAGNKKITNVADGVDAHDAATVGQLGKLAEDAGKGLNELGNQISKLDGRVNKVGAGAAALAAMHPLDFDPDDKWNVSAGYGSYKGSHAGAIGAFYRPDENTMFNIGASVGGGENMVNAGVTFALDRKSHITTSRTAMAREIMDLRKEITELKAARANGNWMLDPEMTKLFPDVPENHWAYEYIAKLAGNGIIKGYPDGSFAGNRMMTRYEFAALLYRAMENGANVDARALKEFAPEMGRIRVDRVYGKDNDRNKIERVRVNNENTQERDTYGSKIQVAAK